MFKKLIYVVARLAPTFIVRKTGPLSQEVASYFPKIASTCTVPVRNRCTRVNLPLLLTEAVYLLDNFHTSNYLKKVLQKL